MDTGSQTEELQQTGCIDPVFVTIIPPQGAAYSVSRISPSVRPIVRPLARPCLGATMAWDWSILFPPSGRASVLKVETKGKREWRVEKRRAKSRLKGVKNMRQKTLERDREDKMKGRRGGE